MTQEEMKLLKQMGMKDEVIVDQQQKIEAFENDIQKQIEAVKGLINTSNTIRNMQQQGTIQGCSGLANNSLMEELNNQILALRTLTETLKPYLNGEKLEVQ